MALAQLYLLVLWMCSFQEMGKANVCYKFLKYVSLRQPFCSSLFLSRLQTRYTTHLCHSPWLTDPIVQMQNWLCHDSFGLAGKKKRWVKGSGGGAGERGEAKANEDEEKYVYCEAINWSLSQFWKIKSDVPIVRFWRCHFVWQISVPCRWALTGGRNGSDSSSPDDGDVNEYNAYLYI